MTAVGNNEDDFYKNCPPSTCGGLKIRFPFRLESSHPSCGAPGMELSCSGNETILVLPQKVASYKVTDINYVNGRITINLGDCPLQNHTSINLTTSVYHALATVPFSLVGCPRELDISNRYVQIAGTVSCLSSENQFIYMVYPDENMEDFLSDCVVVSNGHSLPAIDEDNTFKNMVDNFIKRQEVTLQWSVPPITDECCACEVEGKACDFSSQNNKTFCGHRIHGSHAKLIAGSLLPRVKVFSWRCISVYLPVLAKLHKINANSVDTCTLCSQDSESIDHLFIACPLAQVVWLSSRYGIRASEKRTGLFSWLSTLFKSLGEEGITYCLSLLWSIWHARNASWHNGMEARPLNIIANIHRGLLSEGTKLKEGEKSVIRAAEVGSHGYLHADLNIEALNAAMGTTDPRDIDVFIWVDAAWRKL